MKLSEYKKVALDYTAKASEIARQLILAGVAIVWIFKKTENHVDYIPKLLTLPLILLCLAALCDLFQYIYGGKRWTKFFLEKEKEVRKARHEDASLPIDPEVSGPKIYGKTIEFFYLAKMWLLVLAYIFLGFFLIHTLGSK